MSIENILERIATALETIAGKANSDKPKLDVEKAKASAAKITEEIREKQKGIRTDQKEVVEEQNEIVEEQAEAKPEPESDIKWADVNKAFFGALTKIKAVAGLEKAKQVSAKLSKKYSGGSPPSASNTKTEQYAEFLADIESALKEHIKNG